MDTKKISTIFSSSNLINKETSEAKNALTKIFDNKNINLESFSSRIDEISNSVEYTDEKFKTFLKTSLESGKSYANAQEALAGYEAYLKSTTKSLSLADIGTKALSASMKVLSSIGWMVAISAATWAISEVVGWISDYIHRVDIAIEELDEAKANLEQTKSELDDIGRRIDELNAKRNLSLIEAEELENLKKTNTELERELALRESIAKAKGEKANKETVDYFTKSHPNRTLLKGDSFGGSTITAPVYFDKIHELTNEINTLERLKNELDETQDIKKGDYLKKTISSLSLSISESMTDFMDKDDFLIEGMDEGVIARLERLYTLYDKVTKGESFIDTSAIKGILNTSDFIGVEESLISLGKTGSLSVAKLINEFPDLIQCLEKSGVSAEQLYQYIMNLADPDALDYENLKEQLLNSLGYGNLWKPVRDDKVKWLDDLGLLTEESLEAYVRVKARFTNGETDYWTSEDWIANIQAELSKKDMPVTFSFSEENIQAIDEFRAKASTLQTALDNLESGKEFDLSKLYTEFPELVNSTDDLSTAIRLLLDNELSNLYHTLGENIPPNLADSLQELAGKAIDASLSVKETFSSIQKSFKVLNDFNTAMSEGMSDSVLSSVSSLSEELNTMVAGFYAGAVSAEQLYSALTEHYNHDLVNYSEALIAKNKFSNDFYNSVGMTNADVINQSKEDYGVDISNCKNYNSAKLEIERQTLMLIGGMWKKYYDTQSKTYTADMKRLFKEAQVEKASGVKDSDNDFLQSYYQIKEQAAAYERAVAGLDSIVYDGIESNFKNK